MDSKAILGLSVLLNFVAFGTLARLYISPRLQIMHRDRAIAVLVAPHMFRFVGLSFLMPGVVSAAMPRAFAVPAAYGDLLASILAIVAMLGLASRAFWALGAVWLMNVEGALDLLFAFYQGLVGAHAPPGALSAAFYIPSAIVPPLLVTHVLLLRLLLRAPNLGDARRSNLIPGRT